MDIKERLRLRISRIKRLLEFVVEHGAIKILYKEKSEK